MKLIRSLLACLSAILICFIAISILDVVISALHLRAYTSTLFVVTFGVGGIFGATTGYMFGIEQSVRDEKSRWVLISFIIAFGLFIFFFLSELEGGEYKAAFKGFGVTLAIGSLLFVRGKVDF